MKQIITVISFLISISLHANDSLIISRLLQRIEHLQIEKDGVFRAGSIPSYRMYALNKDRFIADINPFFLQLPPLLCMM